jgi:hypothetical protein
MDAAAKLRLKPGSTVAILDIPDSAELGLPENVPGSAAPAGADAVIAFGRAVPSDRPSSSSDRWVQLFARRTSMQYALLIYTRPGSLDVLSESERREIYGEYEAVNALPGCVGTAQLQPIETATTVRVQDGNTLTTDGPFANTKEVFAGYFVFEADNLDKAIEIARRIPAARMGGGVEVRPLVER